MRRFDGKRLRRPRWLAAAALVALVALAATAAIAIGARDQAARLAPWLMIGGMVGAYALMMIASIPRRASITVDGREVHASWRGRPVRVERIDVGRWVLAALDTPTGALMVLHGDDGARLRIGGQHHDGAGYPGDVRARSVDFAIDAAAFDELAALLGVARGDDQLAVELVRSSQSARGIAATMAPWLITMALLAAGGLALGLSGAGDWLAQRRYGNAIMGVGTGAVAVLGLAITMARSMRAKRPSLIVRATAVGLVLARAGGDELARAPWGAVRAEPRRHVVRTRGGSSTAAVIVLAIGGESLAIGAYDAGEAWPEEVPKVRRAPRWLAGGAQWARLIALLRTHGALRGDAATTA